MASCIFAIILCSQVWLLPAILTDLLLANAPRSIPFWFGDWLIIVFAILVASRSGVPISRDSFDAARLDGCGPLRTYWHLVLPAIRPTLVAVALFAFLATLQEFIRPLLYMADERPAPRPFGFDRVPAVALFNSDQPLAIMIALSCLMTLPLIAVFLLDQRRSLGSAMPAPPNARSG